MLPRAITTDEHALIQIDGQWVELLACIPAPAIVFRARVNGTPAGTDQLAAIVYDTPSGTLADVLPGMTILVGSALDACDVGQARIRKDPDSTHFYIGEESELDVLDNQYLTVLDEQGLWERAPRIVSGVPYADYDVAYSNQHASRLPVVVMGGPAVLELRGPTATAHFDATNSWVPGGGSATYLWAAPGAASHSSTSGATFDAAYDTAGRYRVSCTVTIGGVVNTRYEWVQVFDADNPPTTQFSARSGGGAKSQGGHTFQMTLYAEADLTLVRDRAQVILFTRDHFGSQGQVATGYATGRENILAIGWIAGETIVWSPELSSVTFQVEGAHAWLARITAFALGVEDTTASPSAWTKYQNLTVPAMLWHLLIWRSTVAQAIDCLVEPDTRRAEEFQGAATSLWEQIGIVANLSILAAPCTDHLSRLFVLVDSQYRPDRSGVVEVMALQKDDWRPPIQITRNPVSNSAMVDMSGVSWDGSAGASIFSLSPGRVFKHFGKVISQQALLLTDQAQANTLCGLIAGQANNDYPSIQVQLAGNNRFLDIAPDCYVKLTLAAADTPRGIAFTDKRLIPRKVSWAYDPSPTGGGWLQWSVDFEGETFAELAVTGDAPATEPVPLPTPPPTENCPTGYHWDDGLGACVPNSTPGQGDPNNVVAFTDTYFGFTLNALSGSPDWLNRTGSFSGSIVSVCLASFDPTNAAFVLTTQKLYIVSDYQHGSFTWTPILDISDISVSNDGGALTIDFMNFVQSPITDANLVWVGAVGHNGSIDEQAVLVLVTVDTVGLTGSILAQGIGAGANGTGPGYIVLRIVASFTDHYVMYAAIARSGSNSIWQKFEKSGGGVVATAEHTFTAGGSTVGVDMDADYPTDALTQYAMTDTGGDWHLWRSLDRGATWSDVLDIAHSGTAGISAVGQRILINIATQNPDDVLVGFNISGTQSDFYRSTDGGDTWTLVHTGNYGNNSGVLAVGRWPYDPNIVFWIGSAGPYATLDNFATVLSLLGNWASVMGAAWLNGINLIPIWLSL